MSKLNQSTFKSITDMLKDSDDVSITNIPTFTANVGFVNSLNEIKRYFDKNKGRDITVIISSR
jgi:hypothetical protein